MSLLVSDPTDSFDVAAAEGAVSAATCGDGNAALKACLDHIRVSSNTAARSSVTYNVWQEWIQSYTDREYR